MPSKKYAMAGTDCVACGKCAKECPAGSIILKLREEM